MLRALHAMIRRTSFVGALLLTLAFLAPAAESHACPDEPPVAGLTAFVDSGADDGEGCPDCGPACAQGCCHASHTAVAPDAPRPRPVAATPYRVAWSDVEGRPLDRPSGPERPPRA